jgi:hypothetical protein
MRWTDTGMTIVSWMFIQAVGLLCASQLQNMQPFNSPVQSNTPECAYSTYMRVISLRDPTYYSVYDTQEIG